MFRNEKEFRDYIEKFLKAEGYEVKKEVNVPEGYRIDLLARKDDLSIGIEVKYERQGIHDDIMKCHNLHKLPEFDEMYVAAPKILVSEDHVAHARSLRVGMLGVVEESVDYLVKSDRLNPAQLGGGGGLPNQEIVAGGDFRVHRNVRNVGDKLAR